MEYVRLGSTGLKVSRLCLGCMTYGDPSWRPWVLQEEPSLPFIREALDAGINFFDTANVYSFGESERILGRAVKAAGVRDEVVIATKAYFPMSGKPNDRGLSRKHLMSSVDASLKRLGTDYIDLFIIHRFDYKTPIEETCETLDALVRAGKIRYLGASSMHAWQFMKMLAFQRYNRLASFVSMQSQYNLISRGDERDMHALCREEGIALTPWSPLGRGMLAGSREEHTERANTDEQMTQWYDGRPEVPETVEAVQKVAAMRGVTPAQVALSWVINKPGVTSTLVGASKPRHLPQALAAMELKLTAEEEQILEAAVDARRVPTQW
jgi:aryl-alcohol dehydrogenase (NADP+)